VLKAKVMSAKVLDNERASRRCYWVCPVCTDSLPLSHSVSSHSSFLVL
jgi:hypothetical protein